MALTYSIYEVKARFSEVIRHVREGKTVTVSYRGEPVLKFHPEPSEVVPALVAGGEGPRTPLGVAGRNLDDGPAAIGTAKGWKLLNARYPAQSPLSPLSGGLPE